MDEQNSIPDMDFNQSYKDMGLIYDMLHNHLMVDIKIRPLARHGERAGMPVELQPENTRGAEMEFSFHGKKYILRVTYIFVDAEFDQTFHEAVLICDGKELFSTRATCRGIVDQTLEAAGQ